MICSDIGAMRERITDGVNGLHFHTADPHSLADTIQRAVNTPRLWQQLRAGIVEPPLHGRARGADWGDVRDLLEPRPAAAGEAALTRWRQTNIVPRIRPR